MTIKAPWSGKGQKSRVCKHTHTENNCPYVHCVNWSHLRNNYDSSRILLCPNYTDT